MLKYNKLLIFYIRVCCIVRIFILIFYNLNNGDFIILITEYFGIDKYSFYIILLRT